MAKDNVKQRIILFQGITDVEQPFQKHYHVLSERMLQALESHGQTEVITLLAHWLIFHSSETVTPKHLLFK